MPDNKPERFWSWIRDEYGWAVYNYFRQQGLEGAIGQLRKANEVITGTPSKTIASVEPYYRYWASIGMPSKKVPYGEQAQFPSTPSSLPSLDTRKDSKTGIENRFAITSMDSTLGNKGYRDRVKDFLTKLVYDRVISEGQAEEYTKTTTAWIDAFNQGKVEFNDLPFMDERQYGISLSSPNFNDAYDYFKANKKAEMANVASSQTWNRQKIEMEENFKEQQRLENQLTMGGASAAYQNSLDKIDLQEQVNTFEINKLKQDQINRGKTILDEARMEDPGSDYSGMPYPAMPNAEDSWNEMTAGMSPNMKQYFSNSALFSKFRSISPEGVREAWWQTVNDTLRQQNNEDMGELYRVAEPYAARNQTSTQGMLRTAGRYAANPNTPEFANMSPEQRADMARLSGGIYEPKEKLDLPVDPYKQYLSKYPFMKEWLQIPPEQRGQKLGQTRSRWFV